MKEIKLVDVRKTGETTGKILVALGFAVNKPGVTVHVGIDQMRVTHVCKLVNEMISQLKLEDMKVEIVMRRDNIFESQGFIRVVAITSNFKPTYITNDGRKFQEI